MRAMAFSTSRRTLSGIPFAANAFNRSIERGSSLLRVRDHVKGVAGPCPISALLWIGMLETAVSVDGTITVSAKVALRAGSSHEGTKRRASEFSNCVNSARLLLR
jgi:hypothetical protein